MKEIDIQKHELVPKHIILNEPEKENVLKKYGIVLKQLPRISATDPIVKIINGKLGDVVKIVRKSPTSGETVYYRVVIKG